MRELSHAVRQLVMLVDEYIQRVVQRSSANALYGILNTNHNLTLLQNKRHNALIIHKKADHADSIQQPCKMELSMYHLTGVDILKVVVLHSFQIELAAIHCRDGRRSPHIIGAGARG